MNTYREIVYMCLDQLKLISDDAYYTQDHIIFLADKYRAALLKQAYNDIKKPVPDSNYQTICLNLEKAQSIEDDPCSPTYLRSVETIPDILPLGTPRVSPPDFLVGEVTYVSYERFRFVGHNKWLKNIIYCTIGPDNKLYLNGANPQMYYLEKIKYSGIFEDGAKAAALSCDGDGTAACDPLDADFPLEEAFIPNLIAAIVKDLLGASYRPKDENNNANDDLSDLAAFIRRNIKSELNKQISGS